MATSRRNTSQRLTLVILLLASITIVTLDYRGNAKNVLGSVRSGAASLVSPVQRVVADVLHPVGNIFAGSTNYGRVLNDNQRLLAEVGRLRLQLLEESAAGQQLQQVLSDEHLPFAAGIPEVLGEVIAGAASNFDLTVEIDRGTANGVGPGMPVVSGAGLIGTVISASSGTAIVQLIDDPRSQIGVLVGPKSVAVAAGQGAGTPLAIRYVSAADSPRAGESVTTSGLEGAAFPAGIPIGTVAGVHESGGSLSATVTMKPLADLTTIQYVTVLQWLPPA